MMGDRGPLAHNSYGLRPGPRRKPANTGAVRPVAGSAVEVMTSGSNLAPLPAPEGLSPLGVVTWDQLIVAIPGRHDILDAPTVARYAELTAERAVWAEQLVEHGHLLEEVIVSPRGDVGSVLARVRTEDGVHDVSQHGQRWACSCAASDECRHVRRVQRNVQAVAS